MAFLVVLLLPVVVPSLAFITTRSKKIAYKAEAKNQGRVGRETIKREAKRRKGTTINAHSQDEVECRCFYLMGQVNTPSP
jgi:hypothetical protein